MSYTDIPGVNWSTLKYMSVSPRMYRYRLSHPEPRKRAWTIGGAGHCMILEPEAFGRRYVVLDADTLREIAPGRGTKEGKAIVAEHPERSADAMTGDEYVAACVAEAFPGKEPLTEKQRDVCIALADAVCEHRGARDLLRGGLAEETITWTDRDTGLVCKGRLDYLRPDLVIDLKTTRDPTPSRFERDAANYGYAAQVAFYQMGATTAKRVSGGQRPCVIAVRPKDDFDVAAFQLTEEAFNTGLAICRTLLRRLAECTEADYWPGVAPELRSLNLPPWAVSDSIDDAPDEEM